MSSTLEPGVASSYSPAVERSVVLDWAWHAYAVVAAAAMVVVGLLWDISWHMSIGRDTFWTPAHLLIQSGGLVAGVSSGFLALHTTFRGTAAEKASAVSFWGFRAPLGAWVCVLGCGAMLTSAPFDDWWHNAYGLDVRIVSPPHILLGLGMMGIVMGALLRTLALQNATDGREHRRAATLFAVSSGLFLTILAVLLMEEAYRGIMHSGLFYRTLSRVLPILMVAVAVAGRSRWPATTAALIYMITVAGTSWLLMLFPATPKLGPIYQDITHYVPLDFPLMLVAPAFVLDLAWRRVREAPWWIASLTLNHEAVQLWCDRVLARRRRRAPARRDAHVPRRLRRERGRKHRRACALGGDTFALSARVLSAAIDRGGLTHRRPRRQADPRRDGHAGPQCAGSPQATSARALSAADLRLEEREVHARRPRLGRRRAVFPGQLSA